MKLGLISQAIPFSSWTSVLNSKHPEWQDRSFQTLLPSQEEQLTATDEDDIAERILEPGVEDEEPHARRDQDRLHWKAGKVVQLDRAALPQREPGAQQGPAATREAGSPGRTPVSVPTSPPHPRTSEASAAQAVSPGRPRFSAEQRG